MIEYLLNTPVASLIFIFTLVTSIYAFNDTSLYGKFMLHPYSVYRRSNVYTLFTSGLIHGSWMHLIFNMFTFYFFAFTLEATVGSVRFGMIYFIGLILSDIPSVIKHKDDYHYHSLGASGAISAVLFSYILFYPLNTLMIFPLPIPIWSALFGVLYLVYSYYMSKSSRDNINHDAHLFGAITGIIVTILVIPGIVPHFIAAISGRFGI
ncbi:membrane associated rhomboid family serine protease [Pedobacter cryoconitis]|uniref:Membrane associated rhomboid family serine protease n=1 Tax=Pedobacter cryoconitis TaxID=188932 RepID=A0A7W8ZKA8_9SPHI|nr:rhomboid family intramembrane serine protease [Pedobacter cryoconitis]MBB5635599.1 membrane associated rhomboid family serine protease [Pedobacter cryoconitis]MBB6273526.1 membrane associated rhomboid family serine protease [Pedobacter cryoconitis]